MGVKATGAAGLLIPQVGGVGGLLTEANFGWLGSFRVPPYGQFVDPPYSFGVNAMAYNLANNSLFVDGRVDPGSLNVKITGVAEISIPALVQSTTISSLNRATLLHGYIDAADGAWGSSAPDPNAGPSPLPGDIYGLHVYNGKLLIGGYTFYDGGNLLKAAMGVRPIDLSQPFQGWYTPYNDTFQSHVCGAMCDIPSAWQSSLGGKILSGIGNLSVISRTSYGPAAMSFDPALLTGPGYPNQSPYPFAGNLLLDFPTSHSNFGGNWAVPGNNNLTIADSWKNILFPAGSDSILYFHFHGTPGTDWEGYGQGTADISLNKTPVGDGDLYFYDPSNSGTKGEHAYPYIGRVWAFNAQDFADVKAAIKNPWDLLPYRTWQFTYPNGAPPTGFPNRGRYGLAYDSTNQRVFIPQTGVDTNGDSIVHVYQVTL